jgi:hypothetical protein
VLVANRLPILPGSAFLPGAHHPHCDRHEAHLLRVRGRPLCLGCVCVAIGFAIGTGIVCAAGARLPMSPTAWGVAHTALIAPTLAQPWLQWKSYKILARTLLGMASATWLLGGLAHQHSGLWLPAELALSVFMFALLGRALLWMRDAKTVSPCESCPLGAYPTCSWNLPRLMSETTDPVVALVLAEAIRGGGHASDAGGSIVR